MAENKRVWRIPLDQCKEVKNKRGRITYLPKQLTIEEGLRQTAIPIIVCYAIIIILSLIISIKVIVKNPSNIVLPTHFGFIEKTFSTFLLTLMFFVSQIYLIYLDLIRRSRAKTLLLIPGLFFTVFLMIFKPFV